MNIELEDLNLGIEVEGAFSKSIVNSLGDKSGEFCGDGSVSSQLRYIIQDTYGKECASGVGEFNTKIIKQEEVKKILSNFQKPDFACDNSCGLHLHISIDDLDYKTLWGVASDWEFLKKVKKFAIANFGEKQLERSQSGQYGRYSADYIDKFDLIRSSTEKNRDEKYRIVRFHNEYKTLEWRFFAMYDDPKINIKNINMFLGLFLEQINSEKKYSKKHSVYIKDDVMCSDYRVNIGKLNVEQEYNQKITLRRI